MKAKLISLLAVIILLTSFLSNKPTASAKNIKIEKGMIKVSVLYPAGEGKTFDWNYYTTKHIPMLKSLLGTAIKTTSIDKGISGRAPGSAAPYVAIFHMYFESLKAYQDAMAPHGDKVRGDVTNYTNIQPVLQISEVVE